MFLLRREHRLPLLHTQTCKGELDKLIFVHNDNCASVNCCDDSYFGLDFVRGAGLGLLLVSYKLGTSVGLGCQLMHINVCMFLFRTSGQLFHKPS